MTEIREIGMDGLGERAEMTNLYHGKHIWVYELVTDEKFRGKGYGNLLLAYIEKYGKDISAERVALASGLQRQEAHRFYEKAMDYAKTSYIFVKDLREDER